MLAPCLCIPVMQNYSLTDTLGPAGAGGLHIQHLMAGDPYQGQRPTWLSAGHPAAGARNGAIVPRQTCATHVICTACLCFSLTFSWLAQVSNFYSDVLYLSWHFAHTPLEADWLEYDNIPRRHAAHMTLQQFQEEFEVPNRPVIITREVRVQNYMWNVLLCTTYAAAKPAQALIDDKYACMMACLWWRESITPRAVCLLGQASSWAAAHKWTQPYFREAFAGRRLNVGGMLVSYDHYLKYAADSRCLVSGTAE